MEDEAVRVAGVEVYGAALGTQSAEVELVPGVGGQMVEAAAGPNRVAVHLATLTELVTQM